MQSEKNASEKEFYYTPLENPTASTPTTAWTTRSASRSTGSSTTPHPLTFPHSSFPPPQSPTQLFPPNSPRPSINNRPNPPPLPKNQAPPPPNLHPLRLPHLLMGIFHRFISSRPLHLRLDGPCSGFLIPLRSAPFSS